MTLTFIFKVMLFRIIWGKKVNFEHNDFLIYKIYSFEIFSHILSTAKGFCERSQIRGGVAKKFM